MANPTTNYGFVLPTPTDLVTDLPADFDVALQGVDTRLKALQPGTTLGDIAYSSATANTNTRLGIGTNGQVLAVSGGVPAWTTTADVTPLTTKGDLFTFDTADARLGVGTNGQTLVADSTASTGLKWAAPSSGLTLIKTATFSGVADTGTTFDDMFTSTYSNYYVSLNEMKTVTLAADLHLQFRYAGPTTQTTNYNWRASVLTAAGPTVQTLQGNNNGSQFDLTDDCGNTSGYGTNGWIDFNKILTSNRPFINWRLYTESEQTVTGGGYEYTARTYTGFLLKASAGNINGTVSVYGLAK